MGSIFIPAAPFKTHQLNTNTFKDMFKDLKEQGLQIQLRLTLIAF
jgi:hypothetical protein